MISLLKKIVSKKPKTNPKLMRQLSALPPSDLPLYPIDSSIEAAPPTPPEPTPDEAAIVASLELEKAPVPPPVPETPEPPPTPEPEPQHETETPDLTASPLSEAALLKLAELHERNPQD